MCLTFNRIFFVRFYIFWIKLEHRKTMAKHSFFWQRREIWGCYICDSGIVKLPPVSHIFFLTKYDVSPFRNNWLMGQNTSQIDILQNMSSNLENILSVRDNNIYQQFLRFYFNSWCLTILLVTSAYLEAIIIGSHFVTVNHNPSKWVLKY